MARVGKGDLADYDKVVTRKKVIPPTVPEFSTLFDNERMNERQELPKQGQESNHNPEMILETETIQEHENKHEHVHVTFTEQFFEHFSEKITKEDTHRRQTWLIQNETIKRLNKLSKGKKKGFKTEFVNQALVIFLNQIEK
ncbi:hypothetical protein P4377_28515 [Bacillus thuringiensis]|nr:hypothetical protein [Bacillus thuringiensis]